MVEAKPNEKLERCFIFDGTVWRMRSRNCETAQSCFSYEMQLSGWRISGSVAGRTARQGCLIVTWSVAVVWWRTAIGGLVTIQAESHLALSVLVHCFRVWGYSQAGIRRRVHNACWIVGTVSSVTRRTHLSRRFGRDLWDRALRGGNWVLVHHLVR